MVARAATLASSQACCATVGRGEGLRSGCRLVPYAHYPPLTESGKPTVRLFRMHSSSRRASRRVGQNPRDSPVPRMLSKLPCHLWRSTPSLPTSGRIDAAGTRRARWLERARHPEARTRRHASVPRYGATADRRPAAGSSTTRRVFRRPFCPCVGMARRFMPRRLVQRATTCRCP